MTTSQFVTFMLNRTNGIVGRVEMLELINGAQNDILSYDNSYTRTKVDPNLATTVDVFTYSLSQNVRRVKRVYTTAGIGFTGFASIRPLINRRSGGRNASNSFLFDVPVSTIDSSGPSTGDTRAQIIWPAEDNPNTTTTEFFLEQYVWPTQLTAETIQLTIPDQHQRNVLKDRVFIDLNQEQFGRAFDSEANFEKSLGRFLVDANRSKNLETPSVIYRDI